MAKRRLPAGFNVPLGFYDGPEVRSIPRRIRAAAVGVWALCGAHSANKLQDGYVGPEALKELGCTPAIKSALMSTLGPDGQADPLWTEARDGGIQLTKWVKYQRSRDEVKAYREQEAERKRSEREAQRNSGEHGSSCGDSETSARTTGGHPTDVRAPSATPNTKTNTDKELGYVPESSTQSTACDSIAATPAADLVRRTIPTEINSAIQTQLRLSASQLLKTGTPAEVVEEALRDWAAKTGIGPGVLPSLAADVVKRRSGHARAAPGTGGLTAGEAKVAGWASLGNSNPNRQEAIE